MKAACVLWASLLDLIYKVIKSISNKSTTDNYVNFSRSPKSETNRIKASISDHFLTFHHAGQWKRGNALLRRNDVVTLLSKAPGVLTWQHFTCCHFHVHTLSQPAQMCHCIQGNIFTVQLAPECLCVLRLGLINMVWESPQGRPGRVMRVCLVWGSWDKFWWIAWPRLNLL